MMLCNLEGKGLTPAAEISCPKYLTAVCPMTHLEALMAMPLSRSLTNTSRPQVLSVVFLAAARDENVVQVDEGELETTEDLVH